MFSKGLRKANKSLKKRGKTREGIKTKKVVITTTNLFINLKSNTMKNWCKGRAIFQNSKGKETFPDKNRLFLDLCQPKALIFRHYLFLFMP